MSAGTSVNGVGKVSRARDGWLRDAVERALRGDERTSHRLAKAQTTVAFVVVDEPTESVTVLLDRRPPQVAPDDEPAEVTFELTAAQAERFARGELHLPNAVLFGDVAAYGPVRKYLAKDPVLRALLRDA